MVLTKKFSLNQILASFIVLFLLSYFLLATQSRNSPKSENQKTKELIVESKSMNLESRSDSVATTVKPEIATYFCLDTSKLKALGINFLKLEPSKFYAEKWVLTFRDTISKSQEIKALSYFYTFYEYKPCNIIFQLDSILINVPHNKQTIQFGEWGSYYHSYNALTKPDITFGDFNFDNHIDISTQSGASGVTNEVRDYFIYNPKSKFFNNSFSLANASFDKERKLVHQYWSGGHAGKIGGQSSHKFSKEDSLILEKSIGRTYNDSLDSYIVETTLLRHGKYSTQLDTIKRE